MSETSSSLDSAGTALPASVIRWNHNQVIQFAKWKNLELSKGFDVMAFLSVYKDKGPRETAEYFEQKISTITQLYYALDHYVKDNLLEALLEEFNHYNIGISDNTIRRLKEECINNSNHLLKEYMTFDKNIFWKLSKQLSRLP